MLTTPLAKKHKRRPENAVFLSFSLVVFIVITCQSALLGQPIFSKGMVITAVGDTLRGEVGEFGGMRNYQECVFRSAESTAIQHFKPNEIQGYYIENRRCFTSRTVPTEEGDAVVFAEWIVQGGTSLLKIRKEFYVKNHLL